MLRQCVQVRSNGLIIFEQPDSMSHQRYNLRELETNQYSGVMTQHARKRLGCAIDILVQRNPGRRIFNPISETYHDFQLNFITLTVPNHKYITASFGYEKLLGKWIRYMRDKYGLKEYLWKAELQQNQQPHWHITTNEFIPWPVIRWKWNSLMKQEGLLNRYAQQNGNFNPNSTDIHCVDEVVDFQKYLSKELCKTQFHKVANGDPVKDVRWCRDEKIYRGYMYEEIDPDCVAAVTWEPNGDCIDYPCPGHKLVESRIDGKLWDCSEVLKMGRFSAECDKESWERIYDARNRGHIRIEKTDYCEIIKTMYPLNLLSTELLKDYKNYIH